MFKPQAQVCGVPGAVCLEGRRCACCWQVWGRLHPEPREFAKHRCSGPACSFSEGALGGARGDSAGQGCPGDPPAPEATLSNHRGSPGACRGHSCEKQGARSQPLTEPLNSCGLTGRAGGTGGSNGQRGGGTWCQLPNTHSACHSAVTLGILVTNRTG